MSEKFIILIGLCILSTLVDTVSGSICSYYISARGYYGSTYCIDGCCNYNTYNPCCYSGYNSYSSYFTYYTISAGAIAGIVIGCLVALGVIIAIIVAVCICFCQKRNSPPSGGQVIHTGQPVIAYVPQNNAANMQPYGVQGGNVNPGFQMGQPYSTGPATQPTTTYNMAAHDPQYQIPDLQNADVTKTDNPTYANVPTNNP